MFDRDNRWPDIGKGVAMLVTRNRSATALWVGFILSWTVPQAFAQLTLPGGPVVTVTSPVAGAAVLGTVTVSASTSVPVAAVQFQLDGASIGAEDASAPYSASWDTTTASNGSHTLTAVARDALGVRYTSNPVAVAVSNPPPAPAPASVRFEDTDPAVTYTSGWTQDTSSPWSGGTAAFSSSAGAQASFTFTGTSVGWIGGRAPDTGIAQVFVDGVLLATVDTYSKTQEVRVPMFTASGLADASHTLTIQVTSQQNASASGALIVVDAFDVPAAAISRLQETDPSVTLSAGWAQDNPVVTFVPGFTTGRTQGSSLRAWSAGAAVLSTTPGAQATFTFTGTAVSWIGARGTQSGIARVSLDGTFVAEIDLYSPTEQIQAAVFTAAGLADATHTLTIEGTGRQNPSAQNALIVVDAFDVTSSGTRHQDTDPAIAYGAGWIQGNRDKAYSEGASAESNTIGAQATITFTGTGIGWVGARGPQCGIARVFLDGSPVEDIDTYAQTEGPQHTDYSVRGLAAGTHTLTIQVIGKNPISTDAWILVDAFDVYP